MSPGDVAAWAETMQAQENVNIKWHLFRIVPRTEWAKNPQAREIIEAARAAVPEVYAEYDANVNQSSPGQRDRVKEEFEEHLRQAVEGKQPNNLGHALEIFNRQSGRSSFTIEETAQLWNLSKEIILDPFDPAQATLRINTNTDGSWTFTTSGFYSSF